MSTKVITLIGLGGIGGVAARLLPLTLAHINPAARRYVVNLIDPDSFEPHNASRQQFQKYGPKATVIAAELSSSYHPAVSDNLPAISFRPQIERVDRATVAALITSGDLVLLAVDNHFARRVVSEYATRLNEITVISGSNGELTTGTVQLYARSRGVDITLPLHAVHPEIANAVPPRQPVAGCAQRARQTPTNQLYVTNTRVAATMMELLHEVLTTHGDAQASWPDEVRLDVKKHEQRPLRLRS